MTTLHEDGTVEDQNGQGHVAETDTSKQIDWEKRYKDSQAYNTRLSQEIAELKKRPEPKQEDDDDDEKATRAYLDDYFERKLSEKWLSDLPSHIKSDKLAREFDTLAELEPSLKPQEKLLKKLAETDGISIEEAVLNYWLLSSDKLEKAKNSRPIVGSDWMRQEQKEKSIKDMTAKEFEEYKVKLVWRKI